MKLKLFVSTLWMDSILGSMGVVMLDVGGPLWRCKVLQLNSGLVLYAKDGKRQCICMDVGEGRSLPLSAASGGLSPSPLLKQCDSYNAYLYLNTISLKQLKSAPTEKIGTTLISRNSRFCPCDTIICSIAISYYILLRGDLQSPHKKSYCGFCTDRIMLYCTLFMSASVRVTSHVFSKELSAR